MDQRTDEWFQVRLGKVTASRLGDLMATTKTGYGASRANYMSELVVEILTQTKAESYSNAAMQWGVEHEPGAKIAYMDKTGLSIEEVGFLVHPVITQSGASPDGLVGVDGCIEIKCPNTATHIETLISRRPAQKYLYQMQWQMVCADRQWCDFVSYDPRMPENLQLMVTRIERDDKLIKNIEEEVATFLMELNAKVKQLKEMQ